MRSRASRILALKLSRTKQNYPRRIPNPALAKTIWDITPTQKETVTLKLLANFNNTAHLILAFSLVCFE